MENKVSNMDKKYKTDLSETITGENVKYFGEMMALCALKQFVKHSAGTDFDRLYKGLILDISRSNKSGDTISDGYDFAQTAICYLCEHYGKRLNDVIRVDKHGKSITVKRDCLRAVSRSLGRKFTHLNRSKNIDDFYHLEEPETSEIVTDDYTVVNDTIEQMELTDIQRNVLDLRMNGKSYPEIARALSSSISTAYERIVKIRKIYIQHFSEPQFRARI